MSGLGHRGFIGAAGAAAAVGGRPGSVSEAVAEGLGETRRRGRIDEARTGGHEPNSSRWRRAICGDLTGCVDLSARDPSIPLLPDAPVLHRQADSLEPQLPAPVPPAEGRQGLPEQEPGIAPARPVPYQPIANVAGRVVTMVNHGSAAVQLSVYSGTAARRFDVHPGLNVIYAAGPEADELWVHGPNGFLRHFTGFGSAAIEATLDLSGPGRNPRIRLRLSNPGEDAVIVEVTDSLVPGNSRRLQLSPDRVSALILDPVEQTRGWYDIAVTIAGGSGFVRRFAGHLETGKATVTGR